MESKIPKQPSRRRLHEAPPEGSVTRLPGGPSSLESGAPTNRRFSLMSSRGVNLGSDTPSSTIGENAAHLRAPPANRRVSRLIDTTQEKRASVVSVASTNASVTDRPIKRFIGPWNLGMTLGKGTNARVRKAQHVQSGQLAAVKIVSKRHSALTRTESWASVDVLLNERMWAERNTRLPFHLEREVAILKLIHHPCIAKCYDVWENRGELYIIQEYIDGGELYLYIKDAGGLEEAEAIRLYRQLLSGLTYCHQYQICHRDIKPENILLDKDCNLKIIDFGMAAVHYKDLLTTACGSPHYVAPEVVQNKSYDGAQTDIWSSGVVLFVMMSGRLPFCGRDPNNVREVMNLITLGNINWGDEFEPDAADLINRILVADPNKRLTSDDIWKHPLMKKYEHWAQVPELANFWIGGPPERLSVENCPPPVDPEHVDRDVLRTLCILWHTGAEDEMLETIIHEEPTYQRLTYAKLLEFKIESEEHFKPPPGFEVSRSDRHHYEPPPSTVRRRRRGDLLGQARSRSHGHLSVDEPPSRRASKRSVSRKASSNASSDRNFDPYHPSRYKTSLPSSSEARVTLLSPSAPIDVRRHSITAASLRHPAVSRLQRETPSLTLPSSPPTVVDANGQHRTLRRREPHRAVSHSSTFSSLKSRSSNGSYRRSANYKRNIAFNLKREASDVTPPTRNSSLQKSPPLHGSQSPPLRPRAPTPADMHRRFLDEGRRPSWETLPSMTKVIRHVKSSPTPLSPRADRSRKESTSASADAAIRDGIDFLVGKGKGPRAERSNSVRSNSAELLGLVCDEAFRPDLASDKLLSSERIEDLRSDKLRSTRSESALRSPSRFIEDLPERNAGPIDMVKYQNRPLPAPPPVMEHQPSETYQNLAAQKERLLQSAELLQPGQLDDVIAQIDRMMVLNAPSGDRRVSSAPQPSDATGLPGGPRNLGTSRSDRRYVSDSVTQNKNQRSRWESNDFTVRLVDNPEPTPPAIRKKSSEPAIRNSWDQGSSGDNRGNWDRISKIEPQTPRRSKNHQRAKAAFDASSPPLETISEDAEWHHRNPFVRHSPARVRNWFLRRSYNSGLSAEDKPPTPPTKDSPYKRRLARKAQPSERSKDESEEFPMRDYHNERVTRPNKFLRFFGVKDPKAIQRPTMTVLSPSIGSHDPFDSDGDDDPSIRSLPSFPYEAQQTLGIKHTPRRFGVRADSPHLYAVPNRHRRDSLDSTGSFATAGGWLMRLLRIRPGRQLLAGAASKARTVRTIRGIMRDWKRFGVRDLLVEPGRGRLSARVGPHNALKARAVGFVIDVFALVRHAPRRAGSAGAVGPGKRGGMVMEKLCVVRFAQTEGARSSFEKVVSAMTDVLKGRDMVIEDKALAKEMRRTFAKWNGR